MTTTRSGTHRVLVVDDEPFVRRFACRVLLEEGFLVEQAVDGEDALGHVRDAGRMVDVVVSDVAMPRLNGVELLRQLNVLLPALPVILMSGYATEQLADMGIASPCGVLAKPFSGERLIEEVRRCLEPGPLQVSA